MRSGAVRWKPETERGARRHDVEPAFDESHYREEFVRFLAAACATMAWCLVLVLLGGGR